MNFKQSREKKIIKIVLFSGAKTHMVFTYCASVSFSAVLSSYLLGEVLNLLGKLGCFLCVLGSILLVIHAPEEQEVTSLQDMTNKLLEPGKSMDVLQELDTKLKDATRSLEWKFGHNKVLLCLL